MTTPIDSMDERIRIAKAELRKQSEQLSDDDRDLLLERALIDRDYLACIFETDEALRREARASHLRSAGMCNIILLMDAGVIDPLPRALPPNLSATT